MLLIATPTLKLDTLARFQHVYKILFYSLELCLRLTSAVVNHNYLRCI